MNCFANERKWKKIIIKFSSNFCLFLKSNLSIFCYFFFIKLKIVNFFPRFSFILRSWVKFRFYWLLISKMASYIIFFFYLLHLLCLGLMNLIRSATSWTLCALPFKSRISSTTISLAKETLALFLGPHTSSSGSSWRDFTTGFLKLFFNQKLCFLLPMLEIIDALEFVTDGVFKSSSSSDKCKVKLSLSWHTGLGL